MSGDSGQAMTISPLTKRKKDSGELYTRRREVEDQLPEAVRLSAEELSVRLLLPNREDSGYLYDETLVYLLREARKKEDLTMQDLICGQLTLRTERLLRKHAHQVNPGDPEDFYQTIHLKVLSKILDLDSNKGEYAQVMYGDFVATLAHNEKRRIWKKKNSEPEIVDLDKPNEDGHDPDPEYKGMSLEDMAILGNGLRKLPERTATAFVMHYKDRIQIGSNDPDEPTVARHFGVTDRTIRNWFRDGIKLLTGEDGGER